MKNKSYTKTSLLRGRSICWKAMLGMLMFVLTGTNLMAQTAIIGTGTLTASGTNGTPIYRSASTSSFHHSKSIQLLTAAQLSTAGVTAGASITGWGYNKTNNGAPSGANAWTLNVYLKNSSATTLASGTSWNTMISGATLAYSATINSANMPTATGYWVWPTSGFTYAGGAIEAYIEWFPAGAMTSPFTTNSFLWQYTSAGNQAMGTSSSAAIAGTNSSWTTQARFYNTQINYSTTPCSGQPNPGNTISSAASVCSGTSFGLSLQNSTIGLGVSYDWQSSPDGSTWTSFGTNSASQTVSQTAATYYQCVVTCSGDPNPGVSTPVYVAMGSLLNCYCVAQQTSCSGDGITNVVLNTLSNPSTGCPGTVGNYTYFNPGVASTGLMIGNTYTLSVTVQSDPNQFTNAWIDFNADGVLDASEALSATTVNPGSSGTANFVFTVPPGAVAGLTRLRIRGGVDATFTAAQACGINPTSTWGEVEDYDVELISPPPCSGTPNTTTAVSSAAYICPGGVANLSQTGLAAETGFTFQWEESSDDINWVPISGADQATYAAAPTSNTYYHCVVTCSNSGLSSTSSSVLVAFDGSADAGIISGPGSGVTYSPLIYSTGSYIGNLQWQTATAIGGPYTNVPGATLDNVSLQSSGGGTFYVRLQATSATCTTYSNILTVVIAVNGDDVCNAIPLTSMGASGPYTNIGSTGQVGEVVPPVTGCNTQNGWCTSGTVNSVWFAVTAPASGKMSIRLNPAFSLWDSQFALYSAPNCNALLSGGATLIAANDDSSGSPYHSYIMPVCLTPGATYYLLVDGYSSGTNGSWGILLTEISNDAPVISNCPSTSSTPATTGLCGANVSWTAPTAADPDNCLAPLSFTSSHNPGDFFPIGTTTVTYTANDGVNPAVVCSFDVVVTPSETFYADLDGDGYGDPNNTTQLCPMPVGYVTNNQDCNDAVATANPAGIEICNGIDDDCNGQTDENVLVAGPISGPAVQCMAVVTGSGTFSIAPVFDASAYNWTVPSGMVIVSGQGTNSIFVSWPPSAVSNGIIGNISVVPSNACGAGTGSSLPVDINYTVPVRPSSISGPVKLCPGDNGVYSVLGVARASNYVWSLPVGMTITAGAGTNVITVSVDFSYLGGTVSCSAANACGTGPARTRAVGLNTPVAPASISGPSTGVCGGTGVSYTAANVVGATGYFWTVPAGVTIVNGQGTDILTVDFDGAYAGGNITVAGTNACGTGAARSLAVTGAPAQPGVITGDLTICPGQSGVTYGVGTVSGASSYLWTVPGGSTITSGQGTKDILVTWGTNPASGLSVSVNASNACGTSANRILNGISISVSHCVRVGEQGSVTGLNLFPNPVSDRATIVFNGTEGADFNLKVVDVTGRVLMNEAGTAAAGVNQREVNAGEMAAGVYFVVIEMNGTIEQIRMIVE
ncbi:MAG: HYR domain-containing protein [Bacteroidia bacterium]|nr:HYR domain-containing protein [Bacteroidia bacterium]